MDFESPDEIERSYNKKQPVARKVEVQEAIQVKKQRFEEVALNFRVTSNVSLIFLLN